MNLHLSYAVKKYIIQICDDLRNGKLKKDLKRNKPAIDKIFKDLAYLENMEVMLEKQQTV